MLYRREYIAQLFQIGSVARWRREIREISVAATTTSQICERKRCESLAVLAAIKLTKFLRVDRITELVETLVFRD